MIGGVALRVSSPVLVGRAAEAAQLWAAFERAPQRSRRRPVTGWA